MTDKNDLDTVIERIYEDSRDVEASLDNLQSAVINSKSGPFSDDDGELRQSDGGLASGTHPVAEKTGASWIHLGGEGDRQHVNEHGEMETSASYTVIPKFFDEEMEDDYYYDVSNRELWPIMHDMPDFFHEADEESWNSYRKVNREFAKEINDRVEEGAPVWIHDYQNMLVPEMVRSGNEESPIIYTHHIPIPESDNGDTNFELIAKDKEIIESLSATDVIGVHTDKDRRNLLEIAENTYNADVDHDESTFRLNGRGKTKVANVPLGIDTGKYSDVETDEIEKRMELAEELEEVEYFRSLDRNQGEETYQDEMNLIFAPARADYTKGLDRLIDAYEEFQDRNPDEAEKTRMILKPMPTRSNIDEYAELWDDITSRGEENEGIDLRTDWIKNDELVELYRASDVIAAPSYKDGMNLVAKEGVKANATGEYTGTLLLGEGTGSAEQFKSEAVLVDPSDPEEMSYRLEEAFEMDHGEREKRMNAMHENAETYDVDWWTRQYNELAGLAQQLRLDALTD